MLRVVAQDRTFDTGGAGRTGHADSRALLLSQLYPPDIGGSAVLLHEIYSRLGNIEVIVGADASKHVERSVGSVRIVPLDIQTARWGVAHPAGLLHHARLARAVRQLGHPRTIVHCARALPEGVAALLSRLTGGPRYAAWSHGEDIGTALCSRELTLVMQQVYRRASVVFANSRNTQGLLESSCGVPSAQIEVVYPGVDAVRFRPSIDGSLMRAKCGVESGPLLLSVGRLQRRKGHDLALRAIATLQDAFPGLRYVIVGDGEEGPRLERLARELGIRERVVFDPHVSPEALPAYYAAADIFLLPNRIDNGDLEGFGIVFLEAAASACPVIGGNTGGVPEAVADGTTGILVSGTDVDELATAVRLMASDRALRSRLGAAGMLRVKQLFTWDRAAHRVQAVHDRLVGRIEGSNLPQATVRDTRESRAALATESD